MKKLLIDLEKCYQCKQCSATCDYYFHPDNKGQIRCIALSVQEHVCRQCEDAPCIKSCTREALERRDDGMLNRYSMLCTSCKTCSAACPFGVIFPEIIDYKTSQCDLCFDRANDDNPPICVKTCEKNALQWVEVEENISKNIHSVRSGKFFVHTVKWQKDK
ncbi:4Fe-4S dicluster domain-containing protein [Elusimicrobiota bacterium]